MRKSKVQSPNAHLLESPEWLKEQYIDKNLSLKAVGALIPCSTLTIRRKMTKYGIAIKPKYITYSNPTYPPRHSHHNGMWKGGIPNCKDCGIKLKSHASTRCKKCYGLTLRKPKQNQPDDLIRHSADYKDWRNMVFIRDGYKCQICGVNNNNLKAHHLDGFSVAPEKRFDVANGVTLCNDHHIQFHKEYGFGGNTKKQFDEFSSIIEVTF